MLKSLFLHRVQVKGRPCAARIDQNQKINCFIVMRSANTSYRIA